MADLNKAQLIGRLGKDPDVRYMPNGKAVCSFSLATGEKWKDKQTGEQQQRTEWHNIVMFDKLAEIAGEYLRKGSQCYVEGKLTTRKWQDKEGRDRYTTEIVAHQLQLLGGRADSNSRDNQNERSAQSRPAQRQAPADEGFDNDIPF